MFWGRDVILSFWCSVSTRFFFLPELVMGTKSCEFWSSSDTFGFGLEAELDELPGFLNVLRGDADDEVVFSAEGVALSFFVGVLRLRKLPNVVTGGGCCCCCCCCNGNEESSDDNVPCEHQYDTQISE